MTSLPSAYLQAAVLRGPVCPGACGSRSASDRTWSSASHRWRRLRGRTRRPKVAGRTASVDEVSGPSMDLGFAHVDVQREARQGLPEVVYGPGKTPAQIAAIVRT